MSSKKPDVSEGELIKLIYLHLKENGHKKAANVLRKHAPQVETASVNVSLNDLFKKWVKEDKPQAKPTGEEHTVGSSSSGSKAKKLVNVKKPRNAKCNKSSTNKEKIQIPTGSHNQKKKITKKKEDSSSVPLKGQTDLTSKSSTAGNDSDSDSSLDVEKWKKLAFELSDVDIAKMDALAPPITTGKSRKRAQPKKETSKNTSTKPSAKKTKAKTSIRPSKTKKTDKPSKPSTKKTTSTVTAYKVKKTPSKKTKEKGNLSQTDISSCLSKDAEIPKTDGVSKSEGKPKKKKNKKPEKPSECNNTETVELKDVNSASTDANQSETLFKEDKNEASEEKTPVKKPKSKKAKDPSQHTELNTPSRGQAEEKANKSFVDPGTEEKLSKKVKAKKTDSISEINGTKTPSRKKGTNTAHIDTENVTPAVTPCNTPKSLTSNSLPEALISETPVKKSKTKKQQSPEPKQAMTPSNKASLDAGETGKTQRSTKKSKRKTLDSVVQSDETPSIINNSLSISKNTESEEIRSPSTQKQHKEKKRRSKDEDTVSVSVLEESLEPKKKKDKKKNKENLESDVEVQSVLQPEVIEDSLASNPETKKKKKKKDKDKERSVLSTPASEEEPPKKKKKSSKEKEHIIDVAQEEHM